MLNLNAFDNLRSPVTRYLGHAEFQARESPSGIGAAVTYSLFEGEERAWDAIITDGREWHYVHVIGAGVGAFPNLGDEDIASGIERFAATLPAAFRIRHLLNASPLHVSRNGRVDN